MQNGSSFIDLPSFFSMSNRIELHLIEFYLLQLSQFESCELGSAIKEWRTPIKDYRLMKKSFDNRIHAHDECCFNHKMIEKCVH